MTITTQNLAMVLQNGSRSSGKEQLDVSIGSRFDMAIRQKPYPEVRNDDFDHDRIERMRKWRAALHEIFEDIYGFQTPLCKQAIHLFDDSFPLIGMNFDLVLAERFELPRIMQRMIFRHMRASEFCTPGSHRLTTDIETLFNQLGLGRNTVEFGLPIRQDFAHLCRSRLTYFVIQQGMEMFRCGAVSLKWRACRLKWAKWTRLWMVEDWDLNFADPGPQKRGRKRRGSNYGVIENANATPMGDIDPAFSQLPAQDSASFHTASVRNPPRESTENEIHRGTKPGFGEYKKYDGIPKREYSNNINDLNRILEFRDAEEIGRVPERTSVNELDDHNRVPKSESFDELDEKAEVPRLGGLHEVKSSNEGAALLKDYGPLVSEGFVNLHEFLGGPKFPL